ncbi:MAG: metabolite traffic protein EboE [Pseudomonadota bacterium]
MHLAGLGCPGHLTYCTNIHAGEHWPDVEQSLAANLPAIKAAVSPDGPLGLGLRISASMATALSDPDTLTRLTTLLGNDYYVFTVNAFPYGNFHGQPVKDGAYRPDWTDPERLRYTNETAEVLANILPDGQAGTISTVPASFKPWFDESEFDGVAAACARLMGQHAAYLYDLRQRTGKRIALALEPEPFCLLETIDETVAFFERHLFAGAGMEALASATGLGQHDALIAMRTHLGVCYDVCHAAVEFEDPDASLDALEDAGITVGKVQLSSALRLNPVDTNAAAALAQFDEPVYLHQTMERTDAGVLRHPDLAQALARVGEATGNEWRSHFHVPIFLERMEQFDTTQEFLRSILQRHRKQPISEHLEVETYTWDVLPEQYRGLPVADAIARELNWVLAELKG